MSGPTAYPRPTAYLPAEAAEALGIRVGTISREDVLQVLDGALYRHALIYLVDGNGRLLLEANGALHPFWDEGEIVPERFNIGGHELPDPKRGDGVLVEGTNGVLGIPEQVETDRYIGGLRFLLGGGYSLTIVLWSDVLYVTPTGDVAPGLGGFDVGERRQ